MVGLINAYLLSSEAPPYQREYEPMFLRFYDSILKDVPLKIYHPALGEFPKSPRDCDAWMISGSSMGAYDPDPWIKQLGQFVQQCHAQEVKMVGICFGHQLIAHFLGGKTEKSEKGWGVGVKEFRLLKQRPWMKPRLDSASLLFSHQDQVVTLPPRAELLATSDFCAHQMYAIDEHVFCLQGHPEFTPEFARGRLDSRRDRIGESTYAHAVTSLSQRTNAGEIGAWIAGFLRGV